MPLEDEGFSSLCRESVEWMDLALRNPAGFLERLHLDVTGLYRHALLSPGGSAWNKGSG